MTAERGILGEEDVSAEPLIRIDMLFGHIKMESRMRWEGNRCIGEGRSLHYDGNGKLVKDTGWQPTGCVAIYPGEQVPQYLLAAAAIRARAG